MSERYYRSEFEIASHESGENFRTKKIDTLFIRLNSYLSLEKKSKLRNNDSKFMGENRRVFISIPAISCVD